MSKSIIEIYKAKLRDAYLKIADLEAELVHALAHDPDELLSIEWVCEQTGMTSRQVSMRINSGELVARELSARERVVRREDYEAWLASLRTDRANSPLSDPTDSGEGENHGQDMAEDSRTRSIPTGDGVRSPRQHHQPEDGEAREARALEQPHPHNPWRKRSKSATSSRR